MLFILFNVKLIYEFETRSSGTNQQCWYILAAVFLNYSTGDNTCTVEFLQITHAFAIDARGKIFNLKWFFVMRVGMNFFYENFTVYEMVIFSSFKRVPTYYK